MTFAIAIGLGSLVLFVPRRYRVRYWFVCNVCVGGDHSECQASREFMVKTFFWLWAARLFAWSLRKHYGYRTSTRIWRFVPMKPDLLDLSEAEQDGLLRAVRNPPEPNVLLRATLSKDSACDRPTEAK